MYENLKLFYYGNDSNLFSSAAQESCQKGWVGKVLCAGTGFRESWIFEELCEGITSRSTCTETDVRAAISGILYEAKRALKAGRIVRLGDLGSLQIGLNSEGAVSVKEFSSSLITAAHIIFRPGKTLADITKILSYQQVTTRAVAQTGGSGNEGEDDDKGSGGGSDGGGSGEAPDPAA